jgi:hypothetical protein
MQASWSQSGANVDGTFINSRGGGGSALTHWKVTGFMGSNTLTKADIAVTAYAAPPDAVQPNGSTLDTIDCRLMTAVTTNDNLGANGIELFTSLTTAFGSECAAHLFKINPVSNALEFETRFFATGWYYWFASSAADFSGSNFWVFTRTQNAAGGEPEIRFVDYDQGAFSNSSSSIIDGFNSVGGFRWGDYFGGQLDWGDYSANFSIPGRPAKVWLYGEHGSAGTWDTHVGATSVFNQGNLSSVTPSTTYTLTGPPGGPFVPSSRVYTLTNNGQVGLVYEVTSLPSWLNTSSARGQLFPGNGNVTLSVNASANALPVGTYNDTVVFSDCFNGGNSYVRNVQLVVGLGSKYCTANANSTGSPADITASGSSSSSAGNLTLTSAPVPNQNGVFFHGSGQANIPFGNGRLCVTGNLKRGLVVGASGNTVSYTYDNSLLKKDLSAHIGQTRNFQHWTRDPMGGGAAHNTSNGIAIAIQP